MFTAVLDEEDRERVTGERRCEEALSTICQRAPTRVVLWLADLLERICVRVLRAPVRSAA